MKYIITESKLDKVIFRYLDDKFEGVEAKKGDYSDIVFVFPDEEYGLMGWKRPNNLFTDDLIVDDIKLMFSMNKSDAFDVIGRYVESRYNLKVRNNRSGTSNWREWLKVKVNE
jgi:hypothetical protein